ncbi:Hypothetical predicted protein [Octopus vulgaris]|uniref:Uncharacterized protein n=1 Tax=Octopus vulgaris TaxID=6645 RepID=A0AA36EZC0_OCTVU|nr:Hypothetical predicted protein [Octopus vulgaris]
MVLSRKLNNAVKLIDINVAAIFEVIDIVLIAFHIYYIYTLNDTSNSKAMCITNIIVVSDDSTVAAAAAGASVVVGLFLLQQNVYK